MSRKIKNINQLLYKIGKEKKKDIQIVSIICNQFGDTGKGKYVDLFASEWADVIIRSTGGNNAGHTIVHENNKIITHLVPSGIIYDNEKINILGEGMVIDIKALVKELFELSKNNISYNNLKISNKASVVLPIHVIEDRKKNTSLKNKGIGSTGKGIGPCYSDRTARLGIQIKDLYNKDILYHRLEKLNERYQNKIKVDDLIEILTHYSYVIEPYVTDTEKFLRDKIKEGKKILLEGAQGLLLSIKYGTYPYVTSSDPSRIGTAQGAGLLPEEVDLNLGIIKYPFMTRVGGGPFPTEINGLKSSQYSSLRLEELLRAFEIPYEKINGKICYDHKDENILELMNSNDEEKKSYGIRLAAEEFGATTGRPRRIGWTDAVLAKYAVKINGPYLILTKVDAVDKIDSFNINYAYKYYRKITDDVNADIMDLKFLEKVKPIYKTYKGYKNSSQATSYKQLPKSLKQSIEDFEKYTNGKVLIISNGADKNKNIFK